MNKLNGKVLELFNNDKKKYNISKVCYGKKALDKFADVSIDDNTLKKKWKNNWYSKKINNSVYFVYNTKKGKIHRFISSASKIGLEISYLGLLEKSKKKRKSNKLTKKRFKSKT